jgi:hypothetical protein
MVLEEFRIGHISSETEIQIMRSQTTDLLMEFIASANLSFLGCPTRVQESDSCGDGAGAEGLPRSSPKEILPQMGRQAITREFTAAADGRFASAVGPFQGIGLVPVILDAVTMWGRPILAITITNALLFEVEPLLVQICGNFSGTLQAYGEALLSTLDFVWGWHGEIVGFVCDGLFRRMW